MTCWWDPQAPRTSLCGYHRERTGNSLRLDLLLKCLLKVSHLSHVAESDGALAGAVHEEITLLRVELGGGDDLCELLHVGRLDVHDVE